jgi:SAM-dependent methyltransferase
MTTNIATHVAQGRRNRLVDTTEHLPPPPIKSDASSKNGVGARFARFIDLQLWFVDRDARSFLEIQTGRVLDVGCGNQPYRKYLPPASVYVGIDIETSDEGFGYHRADTIYFHGERWPVETDSFEAVFATETLEHVENPALFLSEAHRALKSGGWLMLTVPFSYRWHFIPQDYWRYTPASLRTALTQAEFTDCGVFQRGNPFSVITQKIGVLLVAPWLRRKNIFTALYMACITPLLIGNGLLGQLFGRSDWGDDCLGYTVVARRN